MTNDQLIKSEELIISKIGPAKISSPLKNLYKDQDCKMNFVQDDEKVFFYTEMELLRGYKGRPVEEIPVIEMVGPRENIYFDPSKTRAAIVTCGGLCPGINDVIRGIVMELYYRYGVKTIYGVKYGYQGFIPKFGHEMLLLTPDLVNNIHTMGGTYLSSSRGQQDSNEILDCIQRMSIDILFVIGGDGTLRAALEISEFARNRGIKLSVIGIPKTIDNDILYVDRSFGFQTAFSEAVKAIASANTEAEGAPNGVGIVQLMGRDSGFIACNAALAMSHVNYVFIPEIPFMFDGPNGFLEHLQKRLRDRKHAVIVVAEGAGQEHLAGGEVERDASGNIRKKSIGVYFKERIQKYFSAQNIEVNAKFIDPSYMIRSIPASPEDSVYCSRLAQGSVHAAMSGRTEMVVALRHNQYVHLPMRFLSKGRKHVDPQGDLWFSVLEATGQPAQFGNCSCSQS